MKMIRSERDPYTDVRLTAAGIEYRFVGAMTLDEHDSDYQGSYHDGYEIDDDDAPRWDAAVIAWRRVKAAPGYTPQPGGFLRAQLPILIGETGPAVDAHVDAVCAWYDATDGQPWDERLATIPRWAR